MVGCGLKAQFLQDTREITKIKGLVVLSLCEKPFEKMLRSIADGRQARNDS